jgi:D-alanyl-lipoteichoic acid acyltransferase DltB (MBOAT superfamily)
MVLGGLWHGASWNFVLWGALHGVGLAVTRMWQRSREERAATTSRGLWRFLRSGALLQRLLTFHFVCLGWVFFRAPTLGHAWLCLTRIARATSGTANLSSRAALLVVLGLLLHGLPDPWVLAARERFVRAPALVQGVLLAAVAFGLHVAAGAKAEPFVYGQF